MPYSDVEMIWIETNRMLAIGNLHEQFCEVFCRNDVSESNLASLRKRKGWSTGRTGRFTKGQPSWNEGRSHPSSGRSAETQFKKGARTGAAARLYKPVGTERLSKEGYLERKINDDMPLQARWKAVHRINWEAVNGPIPKGHALKCLDTNKLNTAADNWKLIPRAVLARLNGGRFKQFLAYDHASPEVRPTVLAIAELKHRRSETA